MTLRIALISDVHANLPALEVVVADLTERASVQPFDAVYCLGDLGGYASQPNEVQDLIMAHGYPTVLGNYGAGIYARTKVGYLPPPEDPIRKHAVRTK